MQFAMTSAALVLTALFATADNVHAQSDGMVRPVVLTPTSNCDCSPAVLNRSTTRQAAYTTSNVGAVVPTVLPDRPATCTSCGFVPLPGPAIPAHDSREPVTLIERPAGRVVVGRSLMPVPATLPPTLLSQTIHVLRPTVPTPPLPKNYVVGRGLIGQPKLYVNGQPVRNFLRYLSL